MNYHGHAFGSGAFSAVFETHERILAGDRGGPTLAQAARKARVPLYVAMAEWPAVVQALEAYDDPLSLGEEEQAHLREQWAVSSIRHQLKWRRWIILDAPGVVSCGARCPCRKGWPR